MATAMLSDDPVKAVKEMIAIIGVLNDVYAQETHALESMDTETFINLQSTKLDIAESYASGIRDLQMRQNQMDKIPQKLRHKLQDMQGGFAALARRNIEALDRMHRLADQVGETIYAAARDSIKKQSTQRYDETGDIYRGHKQSLSMGINEQA